MQELVNETRNTLHAADYVVFAVFLLASLGIGVYFALAGDKQRTAKEFLTGNRSLSLVPVAISILVSFTSAILILGAPAEIYLNGTMYLYFTVGQVVAIGIASVTFVPLFYPLKLTSSFEYLEARFQSKAVRIIGNISFILSAIVYMGFAMFAPASAISFCTNGVFSVYLSISACGIIGTAYTMLGGIKAVVWTDVFQAAVMLVGIFAIIIKGTIDVGGPAQVWDLNQKYGRIEFDEFNIDPTVRHSFWSLVFGGAISWISTYGVNQTTVQRYCSLPTIAKARRSMLINIPGALLMTWAACAAGMVIFAYYSFVACDIHDVKWAPGKNDIVPYFVMDRLGQFYALPGLFVASLFSGALSTVSSLLSSCSAITWKDILEPHVFKDASDEKSGTITKGLTLIFGVTGTCFSFVATNLRGTVLQASHSFSSAVGAPSLGIFLLGALFPFANKFGAIAGAVCGLILNMWLSIGSYSAGNQEVSLPANITMCNITSMHSTFSAATAVPTQSGLQKFYETSYLWYFGFGVSITLIVGVAVSVVTNCIFGRNDPDVQFVLPIVRRFCNSERPDSFNSEAKTGDNSEQTKSNRGSKNRVAPMQQNSLDIDTQSNPIKT